MSEYEKISIIMPVYNAEKFVSFAIKSVLNQTYGDFEFIIIDDCSTDESYKIIKEFASSDNRIRIIRNNENIKIVKSLNIGLKAAKGEFVARIDADDIWFEDKLEIQLGVFEKNKDLFLLGTTKIQIDGNGKILKSNERHIYSYEEIQKNILKYNLFCHSSVMYKRDLVNRVGYYNEKYKNSEDYDYWIRIIKNHKSMILQQALVYYRLTEGMVSFVKRKQQYIFVIKAKWNGFKLFGFRFSYLKYILNDIYIISVPKSLIHFKRFIFGKRTNTYQ